METGRRRGRWGEGDEEGGRGGEVDGGGGDGRRRGR